MDLDKAKQVCLANFAGAVSGRSSWRDFWTSFARKDLKEDPEFRKDLLHRVKQSGFSFEKFRFKNGGGILHFFMYKRDLSLVMHLLSSEYDLPRKDLKDVSGRTVLGVCLSIMDDPSEKTWVLKRYADMLSVLDKQGFFLPENNQGQRPLLTLVNCLDNVWFDRHLQVDSVKRIYDLLMKNEWDSLEFSDGAPLSKRLLTIKESDLTQNLESMRQEWISKEGASLLKSRVSTINFDQPRKNKAV